MPPWYFSICVNKQSLPEPPPFLDILRSYRRNISQSLTIHVVDDAHTDTLFGILTVVSLASSVSTRSSCSSSGNGTSQPDKRTLSGHTYA